MQTLSNPKDFNGLLCCQQAFAKVCKLCQCILTSPLTSQIHETLSGITSPTKMTSSSLGWYIKLKTNSDLLPWYIDSGAKILVMPETLYKKLYGDIHSTGRTLFASGENPLHPTLLGCVCMKLSRGDTTIREDVYI